MEVLSVTGGVMRAVSGLRAAAQRQSIEKETRHRMNDIRRFLMAFSVPIQDSAPHIYISSLPFSPRGSELRIEGTEEHIHALKVTRGLDETYPGLPRILQGHQHQVRAVAFSPDGSRIVSGSADMKIRLWDAETGQPLGEPLRGHQDWVTAVAFSPDGSRIVSGSGDKTLRLWDAETGQPLGEPLRGHQDSVTAVAFSPDGSRITIRLWDAETGQPLGEPLRGHQDWVRAVAFSPDGSRIVSGSGDKTIRLWDAETGQPLGEPLRGHQDWVWAVAFSPDGSRIVSGSDDKTLRLWDAETGQPLGEPLRGHQDSVTAVAFSPDGSRIVSGSDDKTIRLWDAETGQPLGEPLRGHQHWVTAVAFSPDGSRIVSGSDDKTLRLWDAETGQPLGEPPRSSRLGHCCRISPDGSRIVSGSATRGHQDSVTAVAFSPDGSRIVSGSHDKTIRLWDAETGQPLGEPLRGHQDSVSAVAFLPDGSRIVSGSHDKTIRLWDAETGQPLGGPLRGHQDSISTVAFSADGSRIVSGSIDKTIRLWDAETGQPLGEPLRGHQGWVMAVAFSPDGSRIISGSLDKTIRLWDAETGQSLGEPLHGHPARISPRSFSPDWEVATNESLFNESPSLQSLHQPGPDLYWHNPSRTPLVRYTTSVTFIRLFDTTGTLRGTTFASAHTDTPPRSMSRSKIEDLGFLELVPSIDPVVDIVAIHGLGGHREETWTTDGGILWLRDLLPSALPNARVLTYGYDADTRSRECVSTQTIRQHADGFAKALARKRTADPRRPVIFIAHNLGGIIVKWALVICHNQNLASKGDLRDILVSTHGVLFFGTPHSGMDNTLLETINRLASMYMKTTDGILKDLREHSSELATIQSLYVEASEKIASVFFCEEYKTPVDRKRQRLNVPHHSAIIPGDRNAPAVTLHSDHGNLVRFPTVDNDNYQTVLHYLSEYFVSARQAVHEKWLTEDGLRLVAKGNSIFPNTVDPPVDMSVLFQLPMVAFAPSSVHNPCLKGTRAAVLDTISKWANDDSTEKPIFWLCDIAGSGKSTVAMSAGRHGGSRVLGGAFFSPWQGTRSTYPRAWAPIAEVVKRNPALLRSSFDEQFRILITGPSASKRHTIIVIDAIDECKSGRQKKELVETSAAAQESNNLRIFITSRPDLSSKRF
ncbi:Nuclear distribution protein PAC1 {ECO:0000255/HAMAP-Rule:MF_03141} AltName: Full=Lissencephaly-1 homolog {ECO:0000255/HAMAP-Rule:MF_03141}; Short=LIS-1 {ECO:0000255/HAMAP-Rule:MF_03141}; AltName: Full=nudF homolog {ECO:0000255/HAMAP-Rule:MF_03141} [Serendipita indica DSM 11827]|nr:Nuclear distribution protein PAC1 {ECO:0000255/HAMAP-Rule:MF_03141} AltName: Full=Lissencephaly-1 homolog {ECO:0000255/HAMAP-Rule:MF_03141}; Short=LIS-1 {ECO:0000255/HAMAP-Rule:MF_03141}; AltName: Full=nudF homolog {ECO:0000255/HAMAP-Rule:MF_03141} [Serendipita indica DSM 11827]